MVKAAGYVDRAAGIYRATFEGIDTEYEYTDRESGEIEQRWRWVFQDTKDPLTTGEIDTLTSRHMKPRSNALKFFTGMLGRPPTDDDDTDDHIGAEFDVVWGPNQNGRLTIVAVNRVIDTDAVAPAAQEPLPTTLAEKRQRRQLA